RGVGEPHPAPVLPQLGEDVGRDQQRDQQQREQPVGREELQVLEELDEVVDHLATPCGGACNMLATRRYARTNRAMSCTQSRSVRNWMCPTPARRSAIRIRSRCAALAASIRARVASSPVLTYRSKS